MLQVSVCIIVRNEENEIQRCLDSVKPIADQIIVVDTGSTDNTKSICFNSGAEVYEYEWKNDFSMARNFAAEKAHSNWILWLDADEEIVLENKINLLSELKNECDDIVAINMTHYYGDYPISENRCYYSLGYRFYRNFANIKFIGRIHEHLDLTNYQHYNPLKKSTKNAFIKHYGYMDKSVIEKKKSDRNLKLLLKETKTNKDPWIHYHIGSEFYRLENYKQAYSEVNKSILGFLTNSLLPPPLLYKLKYQILLITASTSNFLQGLNNALKLYPDYVDLHFYKGIYLFEQQLYESALATFYDCLKQDEKNSKYLILSGSGSFLAWYYIGLCYQKQNEYEKSKNAYQKALNMYPDFQEAHLQLASL